MDLNTSENNKQTKDTFNEEVSLINRIYSLFFYSLKKKDIGTGLCLIFLVLESIQLVSYAFSDPHVQLWGLSSDGSYYLTLVTGAARIAPLMTLLSFNLYLIIFFVVLALTLVYMLLIFTALRINSITSVLYKSIISFNRTFACALQIFLLIPFSELMLTMIKCGSVSKINLFSDSITCWSGLHFVYAILGILATIVFYMLILMITVFYFDPFNFKKSPTKIDASSDIFLYIFKIIAVVRYAVIGNDWVSIIIMLILSLLNFKRAYESTTYNNDLLECIITIRNALVLWTYVVLTLTKIFEGTYFTGSIYLLLIGSPVVTIFSIYYYKMKFKSFSISNSSFSNADEYIQKLRSLRTLIDAFIAFGNKNSKSSKSNKMTKDEIFLMGFINSHEETCITDSCPLKKFLEDKGNYSLQRMSLLQYVTLQYSEGIKKFPNSKALVMSQVQFNYEMKINIAVVKTSLAKLEKAKNSLSEDFILYIIKQNISNTTSNNKMNRSLSNEDEVLRIEDTVELKFKRFKSLIESGSKFYAEFWGNLCANSSNNLNLRKLFYVGHRLNKILVDINQLWELELKNKKIDFENQGIIQLYAMFLRDILKNRKKAEDITKRLNEEQHHENKREEGDYLDYDSLDAILENQELVIYARANEKGQIFIVQLSNSVVALTGFSKSDAIGAPAEALMPSIYQADHAEMIARSIKRMRINMNTNREALKAALEKRIVFVLPKSKVGYIVPINTRFGIYNDDDFANNFIIKVKMEYRDTKSVYAYYILCRDDFTVDSISSSCLNLGISNDTLKKYIINMNLLVRTENDEDMDLGGRYSEFSEEPKKVLYIRPDLIYPKGEVVDFYSKPEEERIKILNESKRDALGMLSVKFQFREDKILGYGFRFTSMEARSHKEGQDIRLAFNSKYSIGYDIHTMNYARTNLVEKKSGNFLDPITKSPIKSFNKSGYTSKSFKKQKTNRKSVRGNEDQGNTSDYEDGEFIQDNILTKEKISEMFSKNSEEIREFINEMYWFGFEVAYYKRDTELKNPYEDHYLKISQLKLTMDDFAKKIEAKRLEKKESSIPSGAKEDKKDELKVTSAADFSSDSSSALSNVFTDKSVGTISFFSLIMFLSLSAILVIEFLFSNSVISDLNSRMFYAEKAYQLLNSLLYTKFFITEAVLAQNSSYLNVDSYYQGNYTNYILDQMLEMSYYRQDITDTYSYFTNATLTFSDAYNTFITNEPVYIRTLSNGIPSSIISSFGLALSRIPTTIFYVSTVNNNYNQITMHDRNTYELMMNLLNDYYIVWQDITMILVDDFKTKTLGDNKMLIIFIVSFFVSIISFFGVKLLFNKFIDEREKPVDLFLTIKKQKFEDLKSSSENFLNKLLNKFFGNEESEEEQTVDSTLRIKSDDIMIAKFKQKTEYRQSIRYSSEYFFIFFRIFIFFVIFQIYMTFKYAYYLSNLSTMSHFVDIFNTTEYSQSSILLHCNVLKQYFYDPKIPILNSTDTQQQIVNNILSLSGHQEKMLYSTYSSGNYISGDYITTFMNAINNDISSIVNTTKVDLSIYQTTPNYVSFYFYFLGFQSCCLEIL